MARYSRFVIENFKGIRHAEVDLRTLTGANVFALVGLNESGKTTLLEAIHEFSPDFVSRRLVKPKKDDQESTIASYVPRHKIANFTGDIKVEATLVLTEEDQKRVLDFALHEYGLSFEGDSVPAEVRLERRHRFERGDYVDSTKAVLFPFAVKSGRQRKFRPATGEEKKQIWDSFYESTPNIAYYPTFIFEFPDRIYLTPRQGEWDPFYRSVLQDIVTYGDSGFTIEDIVRRIRSDDMKAPWTEFFSRWMGGDSRSKVQQVIDYSSQSVTDVVLGKWNRTFGEDASGKEVIIKFDVEEGRVFNKESKRYEPAPNHDIYVWFEIKDGSRRFKINDRSLGFRWFFSFLLFTQFRVAREASRPVLFLLDEPAANLHAAAQQKLLESFPEIAQRDNMLVYSTHSHYMVDPAWLEQTFIVTNRSDAAVQGVLAEALVDDESLDVQAHRYRTFVDSNPSQTSYFQPIIDRLQVIPSRFDTTLPSVIVEGKSDYYVLEYARRLYGPSDLRLIPAMGSGTFGALVALGAGWGTKFLFLLDSDTAGKSERVRYATEMGAPVTALTAIGEHVKDVKEIEDLLDGTALDRIRDDLKISKKPSKKQISRYFQESLARGVEPSLGSAFSSRSRQLLKGLAAALAEVEGR